MSTLAHLIRYFAIIILGVAMAGACVVWTAHQIERAGLRIDDQREQAWPEPSLGGPEAQNERRDQEGA